MTIVITGANRGIGAALLEGYAKAGREAIGTSRRPEGDLRALDVTDPVSQKALAKSLGLGPVELLICNAGVYLEKGQRLATGYAPEMWAQTFATNVTGVFMTIQALMPNLNAAQNARIAIISSQMASDTKASGGSYIYRASKAAALNLGRNLATDLKKQGIAVGIYHPGWVKTDMGGAGADIGAADAAAGLIARFDALSLATTGCFETWDGRAHPF
jgi:NAD(P)-dependent dehydrogenase (short-subunit alcohol dehydrogenase family)